MQGAARFIKPMGLSGRNRLANIAQEVMTMLTTNRNLVIYDDGRMAGQSLLTEAPRTQSYI